MADIKKYLDDIMKAVYGEQVRGSIHDAIDAINTFTEEGKTEQDEAITEGLKNILIDLKTEVKKMEDELIKAGIRQFQLVDTLPNAAEASDGVIYFYFNQDTEHYDMYAKIKGTLELIDDTTIDTTGFVTKDELQPQLDKKVDVEEGKGLSSNDFTNDLEAKLNGISEGAQVNTIESISVNGTPVKPDESKNVDVNCLESITIGRNGSGRVSWITVSMLSSLSVVGSTESNCSFLVIGGDNFGDNKQSEFLVNAGVRTTTSVKVTQISSGYYSTKLEFGYYEDTDGCHIGIKRPSYSSSIKICPLTNEHATFLNPPTASDTQPNGWTAVTIDKVYSEDNKPEVGGRNYLLGTATAFILEGKGENDHFPNVYSVANSEICESLYGETLTISFDYEYSSSQGGINLAILRTNTVICSFPNMPASGHISKTLYLISYEGDFSTIFTMLHVYNNFIGSLKITNMKVERGEIATDWSPAPEDLETTADNFEGVLPVSKGGTGMGYMTSEGNQPLSKNNFRGAYGLPYENNKQDYNVGIGRLLNPLESEYYAVNSCHLIMTAYDIGARIIIAYNIPRVDVLGGIYNDIYWHEQLAFKSDVSATQLALASLYESNAVSAASADAPMSSPTIDGELSALDQNMVKVYADLCLNPDSGKSVSDVPEHLRSYVSNIVEETLAKRKEEEERYKAEIAQHESDISKEE